MKQHSPALSARSTLFAILALVLILPPGALAQAPRQDGRWEVK